MSNYDLIEKQAISYSEVSAIIDEKAKSRELTYREDKIKEYLKNFSKLNLKKYNDAKKELLALNIARLEEEHIVKVLDIMPKNGTELRAIVSHSGTVLVDQSVTSILDVLNKYRK